jgi:membrane-bound metal-dependent hydrolase YbcI (DUF457 family)
MNKIGHLLFGAVFFLIIYIIISHYYVIDNSLLPIFLIITLFYSLLPDIDKNNSWIKKKFNFIMYIILIFSIILFILKQISLWFIFILLFIEILLFFVKHRGIIHTIGFGIIFAVPLLFFGPAYFIAGIIGYFSHLIADSI